MSELIALAHVLAARTREGQSVRYTITPDWQQGRTTFGGLISGLAVQAMRDVAGTNWPDGVKLRALQTSFIGPVVPGPLEVRVNVLREGKNIRQVQATVQQGAEIAAQLLGVFGGERETATTPYEPPQPTAKRTPDTAFPAPQVPGLTPAFLAHMEARWAEGAPPMSGKASQSHKIYLRLNDRQVPVSDEVLTVVLADVPPTPLLSQFTRATPASSVSWELQLRPLHQAPAADGWWRVDTDILAAHGGYANQVTRLWSPEGELAALGYQVVAVYG